MDGFEGSPTNTEKTEEWGSSATPSDDWGGWDDSPADSSSNDSDGWDGWDDNPTDSNNDSDDWGGWDNSSQPNQPSTESDDIWDTPAESSEEYTSINQAGESWGSWDAEQQTQYAEQDYSQEQQPVSVGGKQFNFSSKTVGLILGGLLLLLALILSGVDKIHISKKDKAEVKQKTEQVVEEQQVANTPTEEVKEATTAKVASNSVVLVEIPESTSMNYATDVLETNGTVISKTKYVQGNQVLYCVRIQVNFGSSAENINYYCNYASYNQVSKGDIVVIHYQQVEDSYISVNSISK